MPHPQPANAQAVAGLALEAYGRLSGESWAAERADRLARFLKERMIVGPQGQLFWEHDLRIRYKSPREDAEWRRYEDISHGALVARFVLTMARQGRVFGEEDIRRLTQTALHGFAQRTDGILFADLAGRGTSPPRLARNAAVWLPVATASPELYPRILRFYLRYFPEPTPWELACLIRYRPTSETGGP